MHIVQFLFDNSDNNIHDVIDLVIDDDDDDDHYNWKYYLNRYQVSVFVWSLRMNSLVALL